LAGSLRNGGQRTAGVHGTGANAGILGSELSKSDSGKGNGEQEGRADDNVTKAKKLRLRERACKPRCRHISLLLGQAGGRRRRQRGLSVQGGHTPSNRFMPEQTERSEKGTCRAGRSRKPSVRLGNCAREVTARREASHLTAGTVLVQGRGVGFGARLVQNESSGGSDFFRRGCRKRTGTDTEPVPA